MTPAQLAQRLRDYLAKASFAHNADRQAAIECVNELEARCELIADALRQKTEGKAS